MPGILKQLIDFSNYHYNPYSIPVFLTALLIVGLGTGILFRKRDSMVSVSFFATCLTLGLWLVGMSITYMCNDPKLARFWFLVAFLGIANISAGFLFFVVSFLNKEVRFKTVVIAGYALSLFFYLLALFSPHFITGFKLYFWGWYPIFGYLSYPFLLAWTSLMLWAGFLLLQELKNKATLLEQQRLSSVLLAFVVCYTASADFLPCYGFNLYPFGYIPVLCFVALIAYAMKKYQLLLLTPALAAETIVNTMADALIVFDNIGRITAVNPVSLRLFKHRPDDLIGREAKDIFIEKEIFGQASLSEISESETAGNFEMTGLSSSGENIPVSLSIGVVKNNNGVVSGYVGIARDIRETKRLIDELKTKKRETETELTERIKAETALKEAYKQLQSTQARLLQAEKMGAVGQLAGGIAHEINNPLGVILGFSQSLLKMIKENDAMMMPLSSIEREAKRCKSLVQDLLTFSRVNEPEKTKRNINEVINGALTLVEARAKLSSIALVRELAEGLKEIDLNPNQIQRVVINLCNNAIDAMDGKGTLTVRSMATPAGDIEIQVADTGSGVPENIRKRIFEPFYTTKEVGKGTGLGLSLVYEIVQKHNGKIEFESESGKGTTFKIILFSNGR